MCQCSNGSIKSAYRVQIKILANERIGALAKSLQIDQCDHFPVMNQISRHILSVQSSDDLCWSSRCPPRRSYDALPWTARAALCHSWSTAAEHMLLSAYVSAKGMTVDGVYCCSCQIFECIFEWYQIVMSENGKGGETLTTEGLLCKIRFCS